jgi:hypothetical protein
MPKGKDVMENAKPEPNRGPIRVKQFVERHVSEGWSEPSLRWLIFKAHSNGLEEAGAIVRAGRRVFIDETAFFRWLRSQRQSA